MRSIRHILLQFGRRALVLVTPVLLAACEAEPDITSTDAPAGPVRSSVLDSAVRALPGIVADFLLQELRLDSITVVVWTECARNGRIALVGAPYRSGINCRFAIVDRYPRRFVVYVPGGFSVTENAPGAVVVMHHGSSGSGEQFLNISGWREEADEHGFIAAFPTGVIYDVIDGFHSTKWNSFALAGQVNLNFRPIGYPANAPWPADDVRFERLILDDLAAQLPIDARRLYAAGFSNGAEFTARLGIELSDRYAAVGLVAGGLDTIRTPVQNIPVILGLGTDDDRILERVNATLAAAGRPALPGLPINADSLRRLPDITSFFDTMVRSFGLEPTSFTVSSDQQTITQLLWQTPQPGNTAGNVMIGAVLAGVSHQFPRGPRPGKTQNNPLGFDAADRFWSFFDLHRRQ